MVEYNVGYDSPWSQESPALQPQCTIQRSSWVPEAAPRCTVQPQHSSPIAPFRRAPGSLRVVPAGPHCTVLGRAGGVFDDNFWDEFPMRLVWRHSAQLRCSVTWFYMKNQPQRAVTPLRHVCVSDGSLRGRAGRVFDDNCLGRVSDEVSSAPQCTVQMLGWVFSVGPYCTVQASALLTQSDGSLRPSFR